ALDQPQARHRGVLERVAVEGVGEVPLFGLTARLSRTPGQVTSPPPRLGEHTAEILGGLGCAPEQIAALRQQKVV
ncbi:MAG: CoA transferase, partial [Thermoanaerobaculia bacterium]|nr:CoA transferase [Thermoanaerobaculia bacterium]